MKFRKKQLPFVFVNMAMTADGKIATANRVVCSFGSAHDQHQLLLLRSKADAIMAGARTVDSNPINLGPGPAKYRRLRLRRGLAEYNLRVIVSGSGTINPKAEIFRHRFSPIIVLTTQRARKAALMRLRELADDVKICGQDEIDFLQALGWLQEKWRVQRLLCEGGGELNSALFSAELVNELYLTICPKIFGGLAAPTVANGKGARLLSGANRLRLKSMKRFGEELFLLYEVLSSAT